MKSLKNALLVTAVLVLAGCGGGGNSSGVGGAGGLTASISDSCSFADCTFTAVTNDSNAFQYNWVFGDGSTANATTKGTTHSYAKAGTYTVKLTVLGSGTQETASKSVTVSLQPVVAAFTVDCDFFACNFSAASTVLNDGGSVKTYAWAFGDGTGASGVSASNTYGTAGNFTVTLKVTDTKGATDTASQVVQAGNLGTKAQAIAMSVQMVLSYDNYSKVLWGIDGFARGDVQTHGAIAAPGSVSGPTLSCPGGGTVNYQYWKDTNSNNVVDNSETYNLDSPKACAFGSGAVKVTGIETSAATGGDLGATMSVGVFADGSISSDVLGAITSNEDGWTVVQQFPHRLETAAGQLIMSLPSMTGATVNFLDNDGTFTANPYGANFPTGQGVHPLDHEIQFGGFADSRRQSTCAAAPNNGCQALVTNLADTKAINPNMEWAYEASADGKVHAPSTAFFNITTTTPWDVESDGSGGLYMKAGAFTLIAFTTGANYDSDTQAFLVTVTASGTASSPTFDVTVDGGTVFTIPQANWVSYPHLCATNEIGYGCTPGQ